MAGKSDNGNPGTDVAVPASAEVAGQERVSLQFRDWVQTVARDGAEDRAFNVAARQLDKILSAETLEDIMSADMQETYETRDLVDFEMEVHPGIEFVTSDDRFNSPLGVYVQFTATALMSLPKQNIKTGQDMIISSGAPLVIGKLRSLEANGYLPMRLKVVGVVAPGGTVLKLGAIPERAVQGETV